MTKESGWTVAKQVKMSFYPGNGKGGYGKSNYQSFLGSAIEMESSDLTQPIALDLEGNMHTVLLGQDHASHEWSFWSMNSTKSWNMTKIHGPLSKACQIADPHSNAFIDLDGDCLSDIFLTCADKSYEIWRKDPLKGFSKRSSNPLPSGHSQITFADIGIYFFYFFIKTRMVA